MVTEAAQKQEYLKRAREYISKRFHDYNARRVYSEGVACETGMPPDAAKEALDTLAMEYELGRVLVLGCPEGHHVYTATLNNPLPNPYPACNSCEPEYARFDREDATVEVMYAILKTPKLPALTDWEAERMLKHLSEHYRQPVMPVSKYCDALRAWAECIKDGVKRVAEEKAKDPEGLKYATAHGEKYADVLFKIETDMEKSGLLQRLIYGDEKVRTKMCPTHKGHMDAFMWTGGGEPCEHGCQGSGWLPEDKA